MEKYKEAGLIYGPQMHHLDHIGVLCILMDVPLIVTEKEIEEEAKRFYPELVVFCFDYLVIGESIAREYDVIFSSLPQDLFDQIFFVAEHLVKKKLLNIWCPHGNSDKGHLTYFMEALHKEKIALVYGKKMIDFFIEKKVYSNLYAVIILGNFRYQYYKRCAPFYDKIVNEVLSFPTKKEKSTILYAPTWQDEEDSSSFFDVYPHLIDTLPDDFNLIVKLHPNLLEASSDLDFLLEKGESKPNVCILKYFAPIYPLLNYADIYLGDMSSIGYDFLTFSKPMFFLNQNQRDIEKDKGLYLFRCGTVILPNQYKEIFSLIKKPLPSDKKNFQKIREETYQYVFGREEGWESLRVKIREIYEKYLDEEIHLL